MHDHAHIHSPRWTLNRRRLIAGAVGAVASTGLARSLGWSEKAEAAEPNDPSDLGRSFGKTKPAPEPIPGGIQIPGGPLIHVFAPGPEGQKLPFSGFEFQGEDVEPSTITDFSGTAALAALVGEKAAIGSDGKTYNLEAVIGVYEGSYLARDESRHRGRFAFI